MTETNVVETQKATDWDRVFYKTNPETGEEIAGELHEFFGADPMSYNVDGPDDDSGEDGSGRPGIGKAAEAIAFFAVQRNDDPTVAEVAEVFKMPPEAVAQAVEWHPWLLLSGDTTGPIGDLRILIDGE